MKKILLVEDDIVGYVLKNNLIKYDFIVDWVVEPNTAIKKYDVNSYDIIISDILLPGKMDGIEFLNILRKKNINTPFIITSSRHMDIDEISALEYYAVDYIKKPYTFMEVLLRVQRLLKRTEKKDTEPVNVNIGDLNFDYSNLILRNDKVEYQLIQREADLLRYMYLNANQVLKRDDILMEVWGKDDYFLGRSMDIFVRKIRKYLKTQSAVKIQTIHGIGFKFIYNPVLTDVTSEANLEKQIKPDL